MKKSWLLAGTMLIGLMPAVAAQAGDVEVTFSGSLDYQFGFADADQAAPGVGASISAVSDQSELVWDVNAVTDTGLHYGANIQWGFAEGNSGVFDETYLKFYGDWGRIHLGADDDVVDNMATGGHDVQAHSEGFDGEFADYYTQIGDAVFLKTTGTSDDANKIAYYTPNFGGFEGGISFTPESGIEGQTQQTDTGDAYNILETSVTYGIDLQDVSILGSLGYRHADADQGVINQDLEKINAFRAGVKVGFGPIEVGVGYGDNGSSGTQKGTLADAGSNYQLGVGWDYGLGRLAVGYAYGENTNTDGTEDEMTVYNISIDATVAEGLIVYSDVVHADSSNGAGGAANENEGTVVLVGTAVFF
ncbi:MAG: porin [Alphaproteobacteria bacterium]|nr:porin [Alphaproteobacteria bacterium]